MSVTPSVPGIYTQELPLDSHAIVPAPTSIAAFVGYSHPFKTTALGVAQQIFSFSDYETCFGGLFSSGLIDAALPRAVYQFFLNGGSVAYVVGLQPGQFRSDGSMIDRLGPGGDTIDATLATAGGGIIFTAREPTDVVAMTVAITNVRDSGATFDILVTYGTRVETYRGIQLGGATTPDRTINAVSGLISVGPDIAAGGWGSAVTAPVAPFMLDYTPPPGLASAFSAADFTAAFAADGSLDTVEIFNLLVVPGVTDNAVVSAALAFAERKRAFAIIDPPPQAPASASAASPPEPIDSWMTGLASGYQLPVSQNGALYFPYLISTDLVTGRSIPMAPSGFVAGIYARTDASLGVWKAPAGLAATVLNTAGPVPSGVMNDSRQGVLNLHAINCLRSFSGIGTVVWGARALVASNQASDQSMYVPVRRMTLFIEQTLLANLHWAVCEPNDEPLWLAIRSSIEAFMLSLFRQGAFQGATPSMAFNVKCDASTTTPTDQLNGIVNIVIAFAPLKPAEFVIVQIAQLAGQAATS